MFGRIALFIIVALASTACSTTVSGSRSQSYHTIAELTRDSSAVALVSGTGTRTIEEIGGIPFTVTTVTVIDLLHGAVTGPALKVRQLGGPGVTVEESAPLLQGGKQYVVFLRPFTFGPGKETDQLTITGGGAGLFGVAGSSAEALDPASRDLPRTITLSDMRAQLR